MGSQVILTTRKAWFPNDDKREQVKIFFESFAPKEKEAGRASGPGRWVASQNMVGRVSSKALLVFIKYASIAITPFARNRSEFHF